MFFDERRKSEASNGFKKILTAAALSWFWLVLPSLNARPVWAQAPSVRPSPTVSVPQAYRQMFYHVEYLNESAARAEAQGGDGSKYRVMYRNVAKLSPERAEILNRVAADCVKQLAPIESRVKAVVAAYRSRFSDGKAPKVASQPPSAELAELRRQRESVVLQARERLRKEFGEAEFNRFDAFVMQLVKPA